MSARTLAALTAMGLVLMVGGARASGPQSAHFQLRRPAFADGGGPAAGGAYRLSALAGQTAIGTAGSAEFALDEGFWSRLAALLSGVDDAAGALPPAFRLDAAAPNPFNPETVIRYSLPAAGRVRLLVYDLQGRQVRLLADEVQPAGRHERSWTGTDDAGRSVASGIYVAVLTSGTFTAQRKLTLLK